MWSVSPPTGARSDAVKPPKTADILSLYRMNCAASTSSRDDLDSSADVSGCGLIYLMPNSTRYNLTSMYGTEFDGFTPRAGALEATGSDEPGRDTAIFW